MAPAVASLHAQGLMHDNVRCLAPCRNLNIFDPPSIYDYNASVSLWEPITCWLANVTYHNRRNLPGGYLGSRRGRGQGGRL